MKDPNDSNWVPSIGTVCLQTIYPKHQIWEFKEVLSKVNNQLKFEFSGIRSSIHAWQPDDRLYTMACTGDSGSPVWLDNGHSIKTVVGVVKSVRDLIYEKACGDYEGGRTFVESFTPNVLRKVSTWLQL